MKLLLKFFLTLCILIAGIYTATPLWLPYILARQLPPGWQLEKLEAGYAGFSEISISVVRVSGEIQTAGLTLTATDILFSYQGLKTEIGSLSIDVFQQTAEGSPADPLTLDDLSLPITKLTGKLPQLSVTQLRVALHPTAGIEPGNTGAIQSLVLNFQALKLLPGTDNSFHLTTVASFEGSPGVNGQLDVDVSTNVRKAKIRFPADVNSLPWLTISLEQTDQVQKTTSRLQAAFDAEQANQEWLDIIFVRGTGGLLTHITGKLQVLADFAGKEMQGIEHLSLTTENLRAETENGVLVLDAKLLAHRQGEKITVTLPGTADIQYQDKAGKINDLLMNAIPELHRTAQPLAMAHAVLEASSSFVIRAGPDPSAEFSGDIKLNLTSTESSGSLQASELQIEIEDFSKPGSITASGLVTLNWEENLPFVYTSDDLVLEADELSLVSTGHLQVANQMIDFKQAGDFEVQFEGLRTKLQTGTHQQPAWLELMSDHYAMRGRLDFDLSVSDPETPVNFYFDGPVTVAHPVIQLPGDEHSPSMTIEAADMSIVAALTSHDGQLVSTGDGTFMDGHIIPLATSAAKTDITWQDLDLINLAGKFTTRTQGFATEIDGETWTGFDFDITYTMQSNADINGSGSLKFDSGVDMPIVFNGNTQTKQWNITLSATTIKLAQLDGLLRVAHFELPESAKLTEGYIDIEGDIVVVGDEITANMTIKGHDMSASMLESSAHKASFTFNTSYGNTISASGPVSIATVALAGGVDVAHIRADLGLEDMETFGLKNLYAEVFDGQLILDSLRFAENRIEDTTIELSHINLGRLLAFADIDGLQGTGFLDISLPVGSDKTGVYVKNGTFSSNGPGRLAYTKEGVAGSNIGLQALENFQFKDLSGTINYQSDGAYKIAIHLEGKNPDLYGGHPIVFNLNIGGSLPELFEAMFITGSFEEAILNQIRTN